MKKTILIALFACNSMVLPMELVKRSCAKAVNKGITHLFNVTASLAPAMFYAKEKGILKKDIQRFTSDDSLDTAAIALPTFLTCFATRNIAQAISSRFVKTNASRLLQGTINGAITDHFFFGDTLRKKTSKLYNKYSYKI